MGRLKAVLIDLLAEDPLPEHGISKREYDKALRKAERRKLHIEELQDKLRERNKRLEEVKRQRGELQRERDEYVEVVDNQNDVIDALKAERDEWKRRATCAENAHVTNLEWLYENDEDVCVAVGEAVFAHAEDCPSHPYEMRAWLMSEHSKPISKPIGYPQPDQPTANPPEGESAPHAEGEAAQTASEDTREKLEADVRQFAEKMGWLYPMAGTKQVCEWLDRQAAISERECFERSVFDLGTHQRIAEQDRRIVELSEELEATRSECDNLNAMLEARKDWMLHSGLPKGVEWPRFENNEFVRFGDEVTYADTDLVAKVGEVVFDATGWELIGEGKVALGRCGKFGSVIKRPPIKASDGQPIEVGQTLYGEDGKGWTVTGFDRAKPHSVIGEGADYMGASCIRALKPGWLTHEPPETIESVLREGLLDCVDVGRVNVPGIGQVPKLSLYDDRFSELVERCEKLAGGAR